MEYNEEYLWNDNIQKYERKREWIKWVLLVATFVIGVVIGRYIIARSHTSFVQMSQESGADRMASSGQACEKIGKHSYNCTQKDIQTEAEKVTKWYYEVKTITATVTAYDAEEFPGRNAAGFIGNPGITIACSR